MARRESWNRDDDEDDFDDESEDAEPIVCPNCRRHNDPNAEACRYCGYFLDDDLESDELPPRTSQPMWVVLTALVLLGLMLWGLLF
ncbi:hypothetical protein [Tuwongella immobilis]|uniref:Uncharacterized protein n=1 Tax=Tuwongella immobilis TaxID=692036 RepID=A0A6C2YJ19_9BACT|nr:hypothetical protein [Tuwongella immobilis]VIP01540.1 unnamed protein product [Tuwongella immobilis]VTR98712.1 unnamed protein product [Tuwongella immobilis]